MDKNFKYWFEDNKDKFYISGAAVALVGIIIGGYYIVNKENDEKLPDALEYSMADYLLTQNEKGKIELYETDEGKLLDSVKSDEEGVTFADDSLSKFYLYSDNKVQSVDIANGDKIELNDTFKTSGFDNIVKIRTNGNKFGFLTEEELIIVDENGNSLLVYDESPTDVFQMTDEGVYLSVDNEIHYVKYEDGATEYIDIGDLTTKISQHGPSIIARNNFGSGNDVESILNIKKDSLLINNLKRVQNENKIDLIVPSNENHISLIQFSQSSNNKVTKQELVSVAIDNTKNTNDTEDLSEGKNSTVEINSLEPFTPLAKMMKGFVYDTTIDGIRIIEAVNGREAKRLPIKDIASYLPVFKE